MSTDLFHLIFILKIRGKQFYEGLFWHCLGKVSFSRLGWGDPVIYYSEEIWMTPSLYNADYHKHFTATKCSSLCECLWQNLSAEIGYLSYYCRGLGLTDRIVRMDSKKDQHSYPIFTGLPTHTSFSPSRHLNRRSKISLYFLSFFSIVCICIVSSRLPPALIFLKSLLLVLVLAVWQNFK